MLNMDEVNAELVKIHRDKQSKSPSNDFMANIDKEMNYQRAEKQFGGGTSTPLNFVGGALHSLQDIPVGIASMIRGEKLQNPYLPGVDPNALSTMAGGLTADVLPFAGAEKLGGKALTSLAERLGASPSIKASGVSNFMHSMAGTTGGLAGLGTVGALESPDNPGLGAAGGVAGGLAAKLLKPVAKGASYAARWINKVNPDEAAGEIMDILTRGAGIETNANKISKIIDHNANLQKAAHTNEYINTWNKAHSVGMGSNVPTDNIKNAYNLNKDVIASSFDDKEGKDILDRITTPNTVLAPNGSQFIDKSKFANVEDIHLLQSRLASESRSLMKSADPKDHKIAKQLGDFRRTVQDTLDNHFENIGGGLNEKYKAVGQSYKNNVVPYQEVKDIVQGKINNPKNIVNKFKSPNIMEPTDPTSPPSMQMILEHGGDELKDRMLAEYLRSSNKLTNGVSGKQLFAKAQKITDDRAEGMLTPNSTSLLHNLGVKLNIPFLNPLAILHGNKLSLAHNLLSMGGEDAYTPPKITSKRLLPQVGKGILPGAISHFLGSVSNGE